MIVTMRMVGHVSKWVSITCRARFGISVPRVESREIVDDNERGDEKAKHESRIDLQNRLQ